MSPRVFFICVMFALVTGSVSHPQVVSSPAQRQASLDLAARLLAAKANPAATLPDDLVDPFNPTALAGPTPTVKPGTGAPPIIAAPSSSSEILQKIAPEIRPSGIMTLGGTPLLLIGEKKLKVGDNLTIKFEGNEYTLVVTSIDRTSFRLRLNNEEITRPIK